MRLYLTILLLAFLTAGVFGQEIMPVKDVKPGMTGYGLSVFQGSRIERFNVEVVDILKGFIPGEEVVLIRCSPCYGGYDLSRSGLIAGMSGSPIYIEGKLVGALAYGWQFAQQPLAGVVSVESMLKMTRRPLERKLSHSPTEPTGPKDNPPKDMDWPNWSENEKLKKSWSQEHGLIPLRSPLIVCGATVNTLGQMQKLLGDSDLFTIHSGGIGPDEDRAVPEKLSPGSAIAAQLSSGDLSVSAVGTVTWTKGNEVLAFGHPFYNLGEFRLPIATAYIATIMESKMLSFKLGFPVKEIGTLFQDRQTGLYAKTGYTTDMIPISVRIKNKLNNEEERTFNIRVIKHSYFTVRIATIAIYNFLDIQEATWGNNTVWFQSKIYLDDSPLPVTWSDMATHPLITMGSFFEPLAYLYKNPFQEPNIKKMEVELEVSHKLSFAQISSMKVDPPEVEPGETLTLSIGLSPIYKPEEYISIPITIPANIPDGLYYLTATGGSNMRPPIFDPETNKEYIQALKPLNKYTRSNSVVISISLPGLKVLCEGQELSDLPSTVIGNLLSSNRSKDIQLLPETFAVVHETPYVLGGLMNIAILVKKKPAKD